MLLTIIFKVETLNCQRSYFNDLLGFNDVDKNKSLQSGHIVSHRCVELTAREQQPTWINVLTWTNSDPY